MTTLVRAAGILAAWKAKVDLSAAIWSSRAFSFSSSFLQGSRASRACGLGSDVGSSMGVWSLFRNEWDARCLLSVSGAGVWWLNLWPGKFFRALSRDYPRDYYYYSRDSYCRSLVIFLVGHFLSKGSRTTVVQRRNFLTVFQIHVQVIIIDLVRTSSGSRQHGDEKSGSTVLFLSHFVGVDYQLVTFQVCSRMLPSTLRKVNFSPESGFFTKKCFFVTVWSYMIKC